MMRVIFKFIWKMGISWIVMVFNRVLVRVLVGVKMREL